MNIDNFEEFTTTGLAVVDVWAEWCGPCRVLSPIIDQLSEELESVKIGKLDADKNQEILKSLGIRSIPTILIYKDGEIVDRNVGMIQKEDLKILIEKYM